MYSGVARKGSPPPTSQASWRTPSWGGRLASTLVSYRKSAPRRESAAAPTSSFWLEAGTKAEPEPCSKIVVPSSSTTRQPERPAIACCKAAVRVSGTGGGAGWRAAVDGGVVAGTATGATVAVVADDELVTGSGGGAGASVAGGVGSGGGI